MENKQIIEINGIKLEIDLRTAKRVEEFKIGDAVKLLVKEYSNDFKSHNGVIVGFDDFKDHPTIIIAYMIESYGYGAEIKFAYINAQSKTYEIATANPFEVSISKDLVLLKMQEKDTKTTARNRRNTNTKRILLKIFRALF